MVVHDPLIATIGPDERALHARWTTAALMSAPGLVIFLGDMRHLAPMAD